MPIILVSNTTCSGISVLLNFLNQLPTHLDLPFEEDKNETIFNVSDTHEVKGQLVISGLVQKGTLLKKQKLYLGPDSKGNFKEVSIKTIQCKRVPVK